MKYIIILIGALGAVAAGWLGLQVRPKPFPSYPEQMPLHRLIVN